MTILYDKTVRSSTVLDVYGDPMVVQVKVDYGFKLKKKEVK